MSPEFETRRLLTEERATFVAPSQVPQGESLEDEVFQAIFISTRDFKPATTILQTAAQRDFYFDVKDSHNKMMNKYEVEVSKLRYYNKGNEIGRIFLSDLFFSVAYNSDDLISTRPWFLYQKEKYPIRIKSQSKTLGDFLQKTETQAGAGPCLWVIGATYQGNMKEPLSGVRATHEEVQRQVEELSRRFGKAKPPPDTRTSSPFWLRPTS